MTNDVELDLNVITAQIIEEAACITELEAELGRDVVTAIRKDGEPGAYPNFFAKLVALEKKDELVFNLQTNSWWIYMEGLNHFMLATRGSLIGLVERICQNFYRRFVSLSPSAVNNILTMSEQYLAKSLSSTTDGIPFSNGLLRNGVLEPHSPANGLTYCLPFAYDPSAECPLFMDWLTNEALAYSADVKLIRHFMKLLLTGKGAKYHKALMLIGEPRSGKGTLSRVISSLVGMKNFAEVSLQSLENTRFEATKLYGKPLAVINEISKHSSLVNRLQNVIGGDPLNYEIKGQQAGEPFVFKGMVLITGNRLISTSDETRAIDYRVMYVPIKDRDLNKPNRHLLEFGESEPYGEFVAELSGIAYWALTAPDAETHSLFSVAKPSQKSVLLDLAEQDAVVSFFHECSVVVPDGQEDFKQVYETYCRYCQTSGNKPLARNSFGRKLSSLCKTLNLPIKQIRGSGNKAYLSGIRIFSHRTKQDDELSPVDFVLNS